MKEFKSWRSGVLAVIATAALGWVAVATGGCSSSPATVVVVAEGGINCGAGSSECSGSCTALARDPENCGACGKKCAAGESCSAGVCTAGTSCQLGTTKCATECVDTKTDDRNCGTCGTKCAAGKVCNASACATSCSQGQTQCGSSCVDAQTDRANCGGCGTICKDGEVCAAGKCDISCQAGLTKCAAAQSDGGVSDASVEASSDGGLGATYCANVQSDNANCGACGTTCAAGKKCIAGQCAVVAVSVEIFPSTGSLVDPGGTSVWSARYYTVTFSQATLITGLAWRANLASVDSIRAEIWDPSNSTKLATGSTVNGSNAQMFYNSDIIFTFAAGKAYLVGVYMSNSNTVFPRKDGPSYPFNVSGPTGNFAVSACWSTNTSNTDIFPISTNSWGPDFRLLLQ